MTKWNDREHNWASKNKRLANETYSKYTVTSKNITRLAAFSACCMHHTIISPSCAKREKACLQSGACDMYMKHRTHTPIIVLGKGIRSLLSMCTVSVRAIVRVKYVCMCGLDNSGECRCISSRSVCTNVENRCRGKQKQAKTNPRSC